MSIQPIQVIEPAVEWHRIKRIAMCDLSTRHLDLLITQLDWAINNPQGLFMESETDLFCYLRSFYTERRRARHGH